MTTQVGLYNAYPSINFENLVFDPIIFHIIKFRSTIISLPIKIMSFLVPKNLNPNNLSVGEVRNKSLLR